MKTNNRPIIKVIEHTHYDYNACEMGYCDCPEVERLMNETEYIAHLEKENEELNFKLSAQQDQFLEAVESVFEEHFEYDNYFNIKCNCGYTIDNDFEEHLLQEIKNSLQKSTNLPESQDKSAMNKKGAK